MRRNAADILFVYHYTSARRPFLPSVSPFSFPSFSLSSLPPPPPASSLLFPFPRLSFSLHSSFSCFPLFLRLSASPAHPDPLCFPSRGRSRAYLFYFIIKQTSSCHILARTCVFTRTQGIHVKHSLSHLTQDQLTRRPCIVLRARKIFFPPLRPPPPTPPSLQRVPRLSLALSRVSSVI